MFVPEHLAKFKSCFPSPLSFASGDENEGRSPAEWFKDIDRTKLGLEVRPLPSVANRTTLLAMAADRNVGTVELCISILAWGGMRGRNRDHLFKRPVSPWIDLADVIRNGELTRAEAYDAFAKLRRAGDAAITGMGPAYFTKLLYFLAPRASSRPHNGYIMDQWVGCSINLLAGRQIVKLDHHLIWRLKQEQPVQRVEAYVSDLNTGQDYEEFCRSIEELSFEMGSPWTPELTERAQIADGGRTPHPWRAHVIEQRLKATYAS